MSTPRARLGAAGIAVSDLSNSSDFYTTVFGYCTSEVAMRRTLGSWPRATLYDGCAPVGAREG